MRMINFKANWAQQVWRYMYNLCLNRSRQTFMWCMCIGSRARAARPSSRNRLRGGCMMWEHTAPERSAFLRNLWTSYTWPQLLSDTQHKDDKKATTFIKFIGHVRQSLYLTTLMQRTHQTAEVWCIEIFADAVIFLFFSVHSYLILCFIEYF
jgi:hypothetical protein